MIASEIWQSARQESERLYLRDTWYVLRDLQKKSIVNCLYKAPVTGSIYSLSNLGRKVITDHFQHEIHETPPDVDWEKYSFVCRAKARKHLLLSLHKLGRLDHITSTITEARKYMIDVYAIGLNAAIRAIDELTQAGIVECIRKTKQRRKVYQATNDGKRIAQALLL